VSDLEFGLRITVAGMGIVFGVLILLWGLLTLALRFERRAEAAMPAGPGSMPAARVRVAGAAGDAAGRGFSNPDAIAFGRSRRTRPPMITARTPRSRKTIPIP